MISFPKFLGTWAKRRYDTPALEGGGEFARVVTLAQTFFLNSKQKWYLFWVFFFWTWSILCFPISPFFLLFLSFFHSSSFFYQVLPQNSSLFFNLGQISPFPLERGQGEGGMARLYTSEDWLIPRIPMFCTPSPFFISVHCAKKCFKCLLILNFTFLPCPIEKTKNLQYRGIFRNQLRRPCFNMFFVLQTGIVRW